MKKIQPIYDLIFPSFILKVPGLKAYNNITDGCEYSCDEILKALKRFHTNESGKVIDVSNLDVEEVSFDISELIMRENLMVEKMISFYKSKPKIIIIGGDHSISYLTTLAFLNNCVVSNRQPCLVVFDAHADCMPVKQDTTHEDWLSKVVESGFPAENILLIGIRNSMKEELEFLNNHNIQTILPNQMVGRLPCVISKIKEFCSDKELYVSLDIDVVCPSFAPGTGYPEPGGFTSREFIYLVHEINKLENLRAVDIVEINPKKDKNNMTIHLGAKILGELL